MLVRFLSVLTPFSPPLSLPTGPTSDPKAGNSSVLVVAEPAVATRTKTVFFCCYYLIPIKIWVKKKLFVFHGLVQYFVTTVFGGWGVTLQTSITQLAWLFNCYLLSRQSYMWKEKLHFEAAFTGWIWVNLWTKPNRPANIFLKPSNEVSKFHYGGDGKLAYNIQWCSEMLPTPASFTSGHHWLLWLKCECWIVEYKGC